MKLQLLLSLVSLAFTVAIHEFEDLPLPQHTLQSLDPNVTIQISSYSLTGCTGQIQVNLSGVSMPTATDYLALYLASQNVSNVVYHKQIAASKDPAYLTTGTAVFTLDMINVREAQIWYFFQNISNAFILTQQSGEVNFTNYNQPCFGRLALTAKTTEMRVTWSTADTDMPMVKYGKMSGVYTSTVNASTSTYTAAMLCGIPANAKGWRAPGQIHTAILSGLSPNTQYFYQYGDSYGWSPESSFVSAPTVGPKNDFSVIILGDMGVSEHDNTSYFKSTDIAAPSIAMAVAGQTANLVILVGDIAYADGYLSKWDSWISEVSPITSRAPFLVAQGNHDRDYPGTDTTYTGTDSGGECGVVTEYQCPMPFVSQTEPWWSFNYGSIHFIVMNTEVNFTTGSAQWSWLNTDLMMIDRSVTPYVIVAGHRPMYCDSNETYPTGGNGNLQVQGQLQLHVEPLFKKWGVPIALWGHSHTYQRTCAVNNQTCTNDGTSHFVLGISGRALDGNSAFFPNTPEWIDTLNWQTHGFVRVNASAPKLTLEYVVVATDGTQQVMDSLTYVAPNSAFTRAGLPYLLLVLLFLLISF